VANLSSPSSSLNDVIRDCDEVGNFDEMDFDVVEDSDEVEDSDIVEDSDDNKCPKAGLVRSLGPSRSLTSSQVGTKSSWVLNPIVSSLRSM
jgi:hypothetical protein